MTDSALRYAYRWGVLTAGGVTLFLYGGLWLAGASGDDFADLTILLAFVCLSPGCLILGWGESGAAELSSASSMGVTLDADARDRASTSLGTRLVPLGFLLTGIGVQGILFTALVTVLG